MFLKFLNNGAQKNCENFYELPILKLETYLRYCIYNYKILSKGNKMINCRKVGTYTISVTTTIMSKHRLVFV